MDVSTMFRVDGMVAVITGGGSGPYPRLSHPIINVTDKANPGIGFMMAKVLASSGAKKVYILGRRANVLEAAASSHPSISPIVCDVTSKASLQNAVDIITAEVGFVNLVIANSGVVGKSKGFNGSSSIQELRKTLFDDETMEDFTEVQHVNVTGAYYTMTAFLELLAAGNKNALRGGFGKPLNEGSQVPLVQSQIIVTSSIGAFSRQKATTPDYGASKAAIAQLAQNMTTNLAPYQIRINTIAPGLFPSDMAKSFMEGRNPETEPEDHYYFIPARRFGTEEELAGTVLYLASKAGAYCNGSIVAFDGGRMAITPSTY
ncbi:short-chain dehydrogenase [Xylaria intraflava]|nr:short-chain dehydrogenase [Xylaria intraflava]